MLFNHCTKLLLTILLTGFLGLQASSQNILGAWTLESVNVSPSGDRQETGLSAETCLWRDLHEGVGSLEFRQDGSAHFSLDRQNPEARFELDGDQLRIHITSQNGYISFVEYHYQLRGSRLVLEREDPLVREKYVFSRK